MVSCFVTGEHPGICGVPVHEASGGLGAEISALGVALTLHAAPTPK